MVKQLTIRAYNFINQYEHLRQVSVYLIIGGLSAISDIIFLFILVQFFKIWYLLAAAISFSLIATVAFFFHKKFTFRFDGARIKLRYVIFLFTAASGLIWNILILFTFVEIFKIWYLLAAVFTKFIVLVWNFLVNKFITFRKAESD